MIVRYRATLWTVLAAATTPDAPESWGKAIVEAVMDADKHSPEDFKATIERACRLNGVSQVSFGPVSTLAPKRHVGVPTNSAPKEGQ